MDNQDNKVGESSEEEESFLKMFQEGLQSVVNAGSELVDLSKKAFQKLQNGDKPTSLQILKPRSNRKGFELDEESLTKIFYHPDVISYPVMVLSVAGAMREGKSFLINLLVHYLENDMNPDCFDDDVIIPIYFKWASGAKRETVGIFMWSKPYVVTMSDGGKIAILLMDTQGAFDKDGTKISSGIFAFSTLISSVQLYNIKGFINENHLLPLTLFTEYAVTLKSVSTVEPFQKLLFVLRDWPLTSGYELDEGKEYLEKLLVDDEEDVSDVASVRRSLKRAFSSLECSLFPDPGSLVAGRKRLRSPLKLSDIDEDFRDSLKDFCSHLFSKENIQLKHVNGTELTGFSVMNFIRTHYDALEDGKVSEPCSALEANNIANAQTMVTNLMTMYNNKMEEKLSAEEYFSESELAQLHGSIKENMINLYNERSIKEDSTSVKYRKILICEIQMALPTHMQARFAKETSARCEYSQLIHHFCLDFLKKDNDDEEEFISKALEVYKEETVNLPAPLQGFYLGVLEEQLRETAMLKQKAKKSAKDLDLFEDARNCFIQYKNNMKGKTEGACMDEMTMKEHHESLKIVILSEFVRKVVAEHVGVEEEEEDAKLKLQQDSLASAIDCEFQKLNKINQINLNQIRLKLGSHLEEVKAEYMKYMEKSTSGVYVRSSTLREVHKNFTKKVDEAQSSWPDDEFHREFKEKVEQAIEMIYKDIERNMETRKGHFRESYWGVLMIAVVLLLMVKIPLLIIALPVFFIAKGIQYLWNAVF